MIELTRDEVSEIASIFTLANTPRYFFDRLLESPLVAELVKNASERELVDSLGRYASAGFGSDVEELSAYAFLAALALKSSEQLDRFQSEARLKELRWFSHFFSLLKSLPPPTTIERVVIAPRVSEITRSNDLVPNT